MEIQRKVSYEYIICIGIVAVAAWGYTVWQIIKNNPLFKYPMAVAIIASVALIVTFILSRKSKGKLYVLNERGIYDYKVSSEPLFIPWTHLRGTRRNRERLELVVRDRKSIEAGLPPEWINEIQKRVRHNIPPFVLFFADSDTKLDAALPYIEKQVLKAKRK
jgi:hypothetical protein